MSSLVQARDDDGKWLPGKSANPRGRLPRQTETKYLEVTMGSVPVEEWAEVVKIALEDALDRENQPHVRQKAREWLARYLIGEPSQLHALLYKEERRFEIVVKFEDNGHEKQLPVDDVIDGIITEYHDE